MGRQQNILNGSILEEHAVLSMDELCRACHVRREWIIALMDEGILQPLVREESTWTFTGSSLRIVRKAWRLQHDLGVNLAGAALALELLEEIEALRARLDRFE